MFLRVFEQNRLVFAGEFHGVVELGRQSDPAEVVYCARPLQARSRVVIARLDEQSVSRRHLEVEEVTSGRVRVKNLSSLIRLTLETGEGLEPEAVTEADLPVGLMIGRKRVQIDARNEETEELAIQGLEEATLVPGRSLAQGRLPSFDFNLAGTIGPEAVVRWLQTVMEVLQSSANTADFFRRAARGILDVVGFDVGYLLLRDRDGWRVVEQSSTVAEPDYRPSQRVLGRLCHDRRTLWQEPGSDDSSQSLVGIKAVVASPILNRHGEVIGALYGERLHRGGLPGIPRVEKVDAMLIELLASSVAAGLDRLEQEKATTAARVQFEQFFTPELARELAVRPDLLKGQERDVTLLFADIWGFSKLSERLGSAGTMRLIGETMGVLSECVLAHRGVLVDYIGDELIAMWGAPKDEPEHPRLACLAALEIERRLPALNERWIEELGEPIRLGIGINTGSAHVGNTGTSHKFKYGALGNTVNLASRVQGATRHLKTGIMMTDATHRRLGGEFSTRRLGKVAVVNLVDPIELYELVATGTPGWSELACAYQQALAAFERQDFSEAACVLGGLLKEHPGDGPSLQLLSRTVDSMLRGPEGFDPVLRLKAK